MEAVCWKCEAAVGSFVSICLLLVFSYRWQLWTHQQCHLEHQSHTQFICCRHRCSLLTAVVLRNPVNLPLFCCCVADWDQETTWCFLKALPHHSVTPTAVMSGGLDPLRFQSERFFLVAQSCHWCSFIKIQWHKCMLCFGCFTFEQRGEGGCSEISTDPAQSSESGLSSACLLLARPPAHLLFQKRGQNDLWRTEKQSW